MLRRLASGVLVAGALLVASREGAALGDEPPKAEAAAPAPQARPHGAIVVAATEGAGPAARALAFEAYRDADLRPAIEDATARVLAGDAPADGAAARIKEIGELRVSITHAGSELIARRLLASLGTELSVSLVVAVSMDGSRPVARVLRPATAAFERVELGPTVETAADGAKTFRWPGAVATLRSLLPAGAIAAVPEAPSRKPAPLAPKAESAAAPPAPAEPRPFYKSPWFWGSVGGAAAIGLTVFLVSRATASSDVHLMGKVGP